MEKKLTAQGPKDRKSYTVTLPIEWVKKEGLDRARTVELNVVGNKIIVAPSKEAEQSISINGDDYADTMIKVLQGLYRVGVSEIRVSFSNTKLLKDIIDILETKLIGCEIVEQKKDYIIIKDITKESEEDFKVLFRRIFLLILELSESRDNLQIHALHKNIKKLINYCQRILMKKGHSEFTKIPMYYSLLEKLEKISDEYEWLLKLLLQQKRNLPAELDEINRLFRIAYELFYKFEAKKYNKHQHRTYQLKNEFKIKAKCDMETVHLHNLARQLNTIYADIFVLKFDEKN